MVCCYWTPDSAKVSDNVHLATQRGKNNFSSSKIKLCHENLHISSHVWTIRCLCLLISIVIFSYLNIKEIYYTVPELKHATFMFFIKNISFKIYTYIKNMSSQLENGEVAWALPPITDSVSLSNHALKLPW